MFQLPGFCCEAFDGEHAAEVVRKPGSECAGLIAHLSVAGSETLLKLQGSPEDHGDRQVGEERNPWCHQSHGTAHQYDCGDELEDFIGSAIEKTLKLIDVLIEHRQQSAAAVMLEKVHFQGLEVAVGLQSQAVLCGLGQVPPKHPVEVLEQGFGTPDQKRQHRQQQ